MTEPIGEVGDSQITAAARIQNAWDSGGFPWDSYVPGRVLDKTLGSG